MESKIIDIYSELDKEYQKLTSTDKDKFPIGVFHPLIQDIILELEETMNYTIEYTSAAILAACSTSIGGYFKLQMKNTWQEKCNLYIILVGVAGSIKSHPLSFAFQTIHNKDKELFKQYEIELKEYQSKLHSALEQKDKNIIKPVYVKSVINDFTPEAFALSHHINPKGVTIVVDELKGWLNNFNRYNNSNEEQMYLSLWSGKPWLIDRKTQGSLRIDDPFVNVIGTIQPKLIQNFAQGDKSDNGFLDRMLFVYPKIETSNLWNYKEVDPLKIKDYKNLIENLLVLPERISGYGEAISKRENNYLLYFTDEAKKRLIQWQNKEEIQLQNRDFNYEKSIFAKIQNYAIRFCLILHLQDLAIGSGYKNTIEIEIVERAIVLAEYFRKVNLDIRHSIENQDLLIQLSQKQKNVLFALPLEFTKKEGVEIAKVFDMPLSTFTRFLVKKEFFEKIQHGSYRNLR